MKDMYGILKDKKVIPVPEMNVWPSDDDRSVGRDVLGEVTVSTVFLVINHNFGFSTPQWFETMIFGGRFNQEQSRYETFEQAEDGHKRWCKIVKWHNSWYMRLWNWITHAN